MTISEKYKDLLLEVKCLEEQLVEDACNSNSLKMAENEVGDKPQMIFHDGESNAFNRAASRVRDILNSVKDS